MQLQKVIDESIIEWKTGQSIGLSVDMKVSQRFEIGVMQAVL